ncbi:universal stress protein [Psychroserpens ponticola]|uniref:Universal stress protein n=1 Tax=Psychroserpens ponticola TaxID=2932268 RepID=A0ABY7RV57_9FLAO|nr:universal stress protein [Psychroserpens ponticola]WCO00703.1 universal stress protein [Psychroserpens ponticola]
MNKIIVPIDFSKHSEYALETAAILAKKNNAEVIALHMLEMANTMLVDSNDEQQMQTVFFLKLAEKKFKEFLERDYLKDITVTPIVKHFKVFREVSDVAKEHNADLIVMGSHGASGFTEILVGSNTEKVVRHSEIPVLVVKQKPANVKFETVVFACDFSEEMVEPYLKACQFFENTSSNLKLLYVNLPGERFKSSTEMEATVAKFLEKADGNLNKLNEIQYISDYTVEEGVLTFANIVGGDLIAVPTHGRRGISHFFSGSIGEDIANHSTLPVITFRI